MTAALTTALDALYSAFADTSQPTEIAHSPLKQLDTSPLLTKPLRELTDDDLSDYHYGVFNTIVEDSFAYFLPRLIELTHEEMSVLNTELIYQKVAQDRWQSWPTPRREAFQSYLDAVLASFAEEAQWDIGERICGMGSLLNDLPERLTVLFEDTEAARENLLTLHEDDAGNSFWDKRSAGYTRYVAWLHSDAVFQRVLEIYSARQ